MPSSYAPVYRPPPQHQSFLTREQKRERKRKREAAHSDDDGEDNDNAADLAEREGSPEAEDEAEARDPPTPRMPHAVSKTDPYYVAGLSREDPLPGGYFPHARLPEHKEKLSLEQELAKLKPPLFVPDATPDNQDGSLRRRHLDNLTVILHKCMLNGDWQRASRAWGLILRTEIQGRGVDVRHNGRWLIGAEILMRRNHYDEHNEPLNSSNSNSSDERQPQNGKPNPTISDEGFRMAREYYERLILQYPHMPRQSHAAVNALAVYPALFNVWIFEVQNRAKEVRHQLRRSSTVSDPESTSSSDGSDKGADRAPVRQVTALEREQAIPIAQRMDEVMLNPPYDKSSELLHQRAMVALWLVDLCKTSIRENETSSGEEDNSLSDEQDSSSSQRELIAKERKTAKRVMNVMRSIKMEIPPQLTSFLEEEGEQDQEDGEGE